MARPEYSLSTLQQQREKLLQGRDYLASISDNNGTSLFQGKLEAAREGDNFLEVLDAVSDRRAVIVGAVATTLMPRIETKISEVSTLIENGNSRQERIERRAAEGFITEEELEIAQHYFINPIIPKSNQGASRDVNRNDAVESHNEQDREANGSDSDEPLEISATRSKISESKTEIPAYDKYEISSDSALSPSVDQKTNSLTAGEQELYDLIRSRGIQAESLSTTEIISIFYPEDIGKVPEANLRARVNVRISNIRKKLGPDSVTTIRGRYGKESRYFSNTDTKDPATLEEKTQDSTAKARGDDVKDNKPKIDEETVHTNGTHPKIEESTEGRREIVSQAQLETFMASLDPIELDIFRSHTAGNNSLEAFARAVYRTSKIKIGRLRYISSRVTTLSEKMQTHLRIGLEIEDVEKPLSKQTVATIAIDGKNKEIQLPKPPAPPANSEVRRTRLAQSQDNGVPSRMLSVEREQQMREALSTELAEMILTRLDKARSLSRTEFRGTHFEKKGRDILHACSFNDTEIDLFIGSLVGATPEEFIAKQVTAKIERMWDLDPRTLEGKGWREGRVYGLTRKLRERRVPIATIARDIYEHFELPIPPQYLRTQPHREPLQPYVNPISAEVTTN